MKKSLILMFLLILCSSKYSFSQKTLLDGKTFSVNMFDINNPSNSIKETLHFAKGKLDAEQSRTHGFKPTAYTSFEIKKGMISWDANCQSPKEGTMSWSGKSKGDKIAGEVIWEKKGKSVITYRYRGQQVKK